TTTGRRAGGAKPADRPTTASCPDLPRRAPIVCAFTDSHPEPAKAQPARRGDVVYDSSGGLANTALSIFRRGRYQRRNADRGTPSAGDRAADRVLCQHVGAARGLVR